MTSNMIHLRAPCPKCIGLRLKLINAQRRETALVKGVDRLMRLLRTQQRAARGWPPTSIRKDPRDT